MAALSHPLRPDVGMAYMGVVDGAPTWQRVQWRIPPGVSHPDVTPAWEEPQVPWEHGTCHPSGLIHVFVGATMGGPASCQCGARGNGARRRWWQREARR